MTNPLMDRERDKLFGADPLGLDGPVVTYQDLAQRNIPMRGDILVDVRHRGKDVVVFKETSGAYHVVVDNVIRHPNADADTAIRALGHYLHDNT